MEEDVRGLGIAELRRLKQLEEENRKLKHLVADLSLDMTILQETFHGSLRRECLSQHWWSSPEEV